MNIQNFCEVPQYLYVDNNQPAYKGIQKTDMSINYVQADNMNKEMVKIKSSHGGRMYIPEYRERIRKAKTVGEIVEIMHRALSASGYNSDMPKEGLAKINEAKHNTQEL